MSYKLVSDVKQSVSGILQGLNLNNVKNLNVAMQRVARQVCIKINIPETVVRSTVTLYDGVTDYLAPANMFASSIVDFRPQGISRDPSNFAVRQNLGDFDRNKAFVSNEYNLAVEYNPLGNAGTGILRVSSAIPQPRIELDPMTATTGWVAGGTASALVLDQTVFWQSPGALRFTLTGSGTGTLTKTISSTDITNYPNVAFGFLAYYASAVSGLTSLQLKIGSDVNNYYTVTVTGAFLAAFIANAWDLASFDLSTATTVGSPVITKITYLQILIAHTLTISKFYLGDVWIALPSPHILLNETSAIFLATGATSPSAMITADSDQVILNDAALAIYELEAASDIAQQQGGSLASNMIATLDQKLNGIRGFRGILIQPGLLDLYRAENPSQTLRVTGNWYDD